MHGRVWFQTGREGFGISGGASYQDIGTRRVGGGDDLPFTAFSQKGGDVKLLAAVALWFPWQALGLLLLLMAIIGGVVTLVTVIHHRMSRRLGQPEVPYGVAISLAAMWLVGERIIYHFA